MLDTGNSALYLAKQSARGIYPTTMTYALELIDGALSSKPTIGRLNIRDGRLLGSSKKRINYFETGGQPTITMQPKSIGAIVYGINGNDTPSGGADPYTHVSIPPTSLGAGSFPYWTALQYDLGRYTLFHDLQIVGGELEFGVDTGWVRARPTFIGMAKEQFLSAAAVAADYTLPSAETDSVHWVDASGYHCLNGDWTNVAHIAVPTDLASLKTALASYKTVFNAHCAVASGLHHKAADATNTLGYATPLADLAACIVALTECRAELIDHEALTTTHYFADTTDNNPSAGWIEPCVTLADCLAAMQDLLGSDITPGCYNRHVGAVANLRKVLVQFNYGAAAWQGTGLTAYTVIRKPGDIMIAVDQLQEDLRLINLAKFGDPAPTSGDEVTSEIVQLGFTMKFIASVSGNERSFKFDMPQFDLDPTPLLDLTGNSEGQEAVVTIGGEATGTAPVCTCTTINDVATY